MNSLQQNLRLSKPQTTWRWVPQYNIEDLGLVSNNSKANLTGLQRSCAKGRQPPLKGNSGITADT
ncbi:unnamed protein product, partial [Schistosoma haematobium]